MPVLVVVGGLPATGKSTICAALARARRSTWLRIDRIEDAIVRSSPLRHPVGAVGYEVAYALAAEQLRCGTDVIAECVNPLTVTRDAWAAVARTASARLVDVEIVCSDAVEHRRRAESRTVDIDGHELPTWAEILGREYDAWDRHRLVVDTASTAAPVAADTIAAHAWPA